jgi:nucleoside-diphosphate-sugar epimerase
VSEADPAANAVPSSRGLILVTGATGFLGSSLVARLVDQGSRVRVLVRQAVQAEQQADRGVEVVVGDITDPAAVQAAVDDVAVVYHLAGKLFAPGVPPSAYRRIHIQGTSVLLAACRRRRGLERFVHCSTTGVLGSTGDRAADEDAPVRPTNVYEASKAEAEAAVRDAWQEGLPAVIVRPGLVYGPGDMHLVRFYRSVLRRQFRPIGRRPVWLHPLYIDDMTDAFIRCAAHPAATSQCFHIAGPEPVSLEELAAAIAQAGGTTLPRGRIPVPAARALAALGDCLPAALKSAAPLTRSRLEFLLHSRQYDITKAMRVLDFAPRTGLQAGMQRTVAWLQDLGRGDGGPAPAARLRISS